MDWEGRPDTGPVEASWNSNVELLAGDEPEVGEKECEGGCQQMSHWGESILYMYTVSVLRHTTRGHQVPLQIAVSHHEVAGNRTQDQCC